MITSHRKEPIILFLGDIVSFVVSLWLTLFLRYGELPSWALFKLHLTAFLFLFFVSVVVFFIAGLYEKRTLITKKELPTFILNAQIGNSIIAVLFFYFIPFLGIAPKINLFLYLLISSGLILFWRVKSAKLLTSRRTQNALLVGSGEEIRELEKEVNNHPQYGIKFVSSLDLDTLPQLDFAELLRRIESENVSFVVIDLGHKKVEPMVSDLYSLLFSSVRFINIHELYEDIFGKIPTSFVHYNWFLENISFSPYTAYDFLKRIMDFILALVLGIISLFLYPFVYLAIKLDDGGGLWSIQSRVGQHNEIVKLLKFRTMSIANDNGQWGKGNTNTITRVGKFLRVTRIDEVPQLWNVIKGDLSLIGPRPEFPEPVKQYGKAIPYYHVRHLIKPGLSGWAQIYHENHPHHTADIAETRNKLSYDLYYIKHRSLALDIKIALRTLQTLLSRSGA